MSVQRLKIISVLMLIFIQQVRSQPKKAKTPGIRLWAENHLYASYYRNKSLPGNYQDQNPSSRNPSQEIQRKNLQKSGPYSDRQNSLPYLEGRRNRIRKEAAAAKGELFPLW